MDTPAYLALVTHGDFARALEIHRERNPFALICGRACPAYCEQKCRRADLDAPVAIRLVKRFMADQEFRLKRYRSAGRVVYHYKIGGSNSIDVGYDNNFFWDEVQGAEWQQTALYINGVRWKGTKFPDIPFIQPEKVVSLPLDINLGAALLRL